MKNILILLFSILAFNISVSAQDLLVVSNNDSVPCRIKEIDKDSAVHFKTFGEYKPYKGYLKKEYYSEIIMDYYTGVKRKQNPDNSLFFISFGAHYTSIPANPVIDMVFQDELLEDELSDGISWSLTIQKFNNPLSSLHDHSNRDGNLSYGFSIESFSCNVASGDLENNGIAEFDLQKQMNTFMLLFSYNTPYRYTTYIVVKPGIRLNRFIGQYDNAFLKSRSTSFVLGFGVHQKILQIGDQISLFLDIDPFLHTTKSGKMQYKLLNYNLNMYYDELNTGFGYSAGLSLRFFI